MISATRMRVLVLAPCGRDARLIGTVLAAVNVDSEACATVADLVARMRDGAGAAIVAEEALSAGFDDLTAAMGGEPSWSDFPLILLAQRKHPPLAAAWLGDALSDTTILPRPLTPETLVSVVRVALRSRRRQYQLQAHLEAQRQRTAEIVEGIYDGYLSMDWQWHCVYVNQTGATLLGRRPEDLIGADMLEVMPHWSEGTFQSQVQDVMNTGRPFAIEEFCPINDRWFDVRCGRSVDGLCFFFSDITKRKDGERHLRLVINELSHRVKNTLAVIQAIADQTFKSGGDIDAIRVAFQGRLNALAETHTLLTVAHWESVDLATLIERTLGHMASGDRLRVRAVGNPVKLNPKAALAIGMTLHELATNAAKYGALVDVGCVDVLWRIADGALVIEWNEQGGGAVSSPTRKGFGTRMVDQAIEYELGGEVVRDYRPSGFHCLLTVPGELALAA